MAKLKHSRQRECIKEYLSSTRDHPTADTVYLHVKKEFPNISLGTVYRNLNLLVELGEISKISTPDGGDRFDGTMEPHFHVFCTECGCVSDLVIDNMDEINKIASNNYDGIIERSSITFYGKCKKCMEKILKNSSKTN